MISLVIQKLRRASSIMHCDGFGRAIWRHASLASLRASRAATIRVCPDASASCAMESRYGDPVQRNSAE